MKKRFLAILLALVLVVGVMPTAALAATGYTNNELCEMARLHYAAAYGTIPPFAAVDHTEGTTAVIRLYEIVTGSASSAGHAAIWDWYYIDRNTGKGRNLMNEPVDLTTYAARTNAKNDEQWKNAYIRFLENEPPIYDFFDHTRREEYKLIDINGDAIPELWLDTGITADGAKVCTYADGAVKFEYVYTGGFFYAEGQNIFVDSGGHMDVYYHTVYSIVDGEFVELHHGNYGAEDNTKVQFDADGMPIYEYFWDGRRVTNAEYEVCLDKACNGQELLSSHDGAVWNSSLGRYTGNGLRTYDEIIKEIRNYVAKPGTISMNSKAAIDAYRVFVLNGDYKSIDYSSIDRAPEGRWGNKEKTFALHDMDNDGTPELFIYNGDISQLFFLDYIFTYADGRVQLLGACGGYPRCFPGTAYPGIFSTFHSSGEGSGSYVTKQDNQLKSEIVYSYNNHDSTGGQLKQRTSNDQLYNLFVTADGSPSGGEPLYHASLAEINSMGWDGFVAKAFREVNDEIEPVSVDFYTWSADKYNLTVDWGWNHFKGDSSIYNINLSKAGLALSAAAEHSLESAEEMLTDLGFTTHQQPVNYDVEGLDLSKISHPAAVFGHREVSENGQKHHYFAIVVRGTTTDTDKVTDVLSVIDGFFGAGTNVEGLFEDFVKNVCKINLSELERNTNFFVAGHSLGGATANHIAKILSDKYGEGNVFGYTFASPGTSMVPSITSYLNIHNIINKEDGWTKTPIIHRFRFGREEKFYRNDFARAFYPNYLELTNRTFNNDDAHAVETYMAYILIKDGKFTSMVSGVCWKCPIDVEIFSKDGHLVGSVKNGEVYNAVPEDLCIYVENEGKYVYFFKDNEYDFRVTGTGEGAMNYSVLSLDLANGTQTEERSFKNVRVTEGKQFTSSVKVADDVITDSGSNSQAVRLYVLDSSDQPEKEVLPDGKGTEIPYEPKQPTLPTVESIPAAGTVYARTQTVKLDGSDVEFQCYAVKNAAGNETNYVKVRDLAMALNGTKAQFNVAWDGKIGITSGTAYQAVGGEGTTPYSGDQPYRAVSDTPVRFNGSAVKLTSFSITYRGGGYTYYKLRDLGQLLDFNVKWDGTSVVIETDRPYTGK